MSMVILISPAVYQKNRFYQQIQNVAKLITMKVDLKGIKVNIEMKIGLKIYIIVYVVYRINTLIKMSTKQITELVEEIDPPQAQETDKIYYFLFVNRKSGNKAGKQLLQSKEADLRFNRSDLLLHFIPIDLYNQEKVHSAFEQVNQLTKFDKSVRIIICGGDGTIQWVLQQAIKNAIDFVKVVFGVLPIGTGNDFAESVGFKSFRYSGKAAQLSDIAIAFNQCNVGTYDIWECVVECQNEGKITQIKNGQEVHHEEKRLVRNFTNYFGLGTDARICYIAQKLRAQSIFMKKVAYGFAGFISFLLQWGSLSSKIKIKQKKQSQIGITEKKLQQTMTQMQETIQHENLDEEQYQQLKIGRFDQCMTFVNSTSSMELGHVWETPLVIKQNPQNVKKQYKQQRVDDGKIQVVSYMNELSVLFQRCMHMAKRVTQGEGPFKILFKKPDPKQSNYIHINGQPYKIQGLRSIVIEPSSSFPNGKIKILTRKH